MSKQQQEADLEKLFLWELLETSIISPLEIVGEI